MKTVNTSRLCAFNEVVNIKKITEKTIVNTFIGSVKASVGDWVVIDSNNKRFVISNDRFQALMYFEKCLINEEEKVQRLLKMIK